MSEVRMWTFLREQAFKDEPDLFLQRLNDRLIAGVPDVHWALSVTASGWFEMKYAKKLDQKLDIRPDQVSWLMQYALVGRSGVLVRLGSGKDCTWFYFPSMPYMDWARGIQSKDWRNVFPRYEWERGWRTHYYLLAGNREESKRNKEPFTISTFLDTLKGET